jgi:hypothetical protein
MHFRVGEKSGAFWHTYAHADNSFQSRKNKGRQAI